MSYPDPFEEKSPWDEAPENDSTPNKETPLTDTSAGPAPFKIGITMKAASGFDAEWLTPAVYGHTAEETAERGHALLVAMKEKGLIDLVAKAADYTRGQYKGSTGGAGGGAAPKKFQNGKVTTKQAGPPADDDCQHGRSLVEKPTWTALFCDGPDGDKCDPLWKDKKTGKFAAK